MITIYRSLLLSALLIVVFLCIVRVANGAVVVATWMLLFDLVDDLLGSFAWRLSDRDGLTDFYIHALVISTCGGERCVGYICVANLLEFYS